MWLALRARPCHPHLPPRLRDWRGRRRPSALAILVPAARSAGRTGRRALARRGLVSWRWAEPRLVPPSLTSIVIRIGLRLADPTRHWSSRDSPFMAPGAGSTVRIHFPPARSLCELIFGRLILTWRQGRHFVAGPSERAVGPILEVADLRTRFFTRDGVVRAVDGSCRARASKIRDPMPTDRAVMAADAALSGEG